ncbi:MAG: hypothetical protein ABTQ29_09240 [Siculibacillus sp.]
MPMGVYSRAMASTMASLVAYGEAWGEIVRLSPMVVALRTDAALAAMRDPGSLPAGEPIRMVAEKIDAAAQGALAATLETGLALGRSLTGRVGPLEAVLGIATEAVAPARVRLRENVERLARARGD